MLKLSREVRFALHFGAPGNLPEPGRVSNAYAGYPPMAGPGMYLRLVVTVEGELDPASQYLLNIKTIDDAVRAHAIPHLQGKMLEPGGGGWSMGVMPQVLRLLEGALRPARVTGFVLHLTPFQSWSLFAEEMPMVRLSQMFEFSAAHRLHNVSLSDADNVATFGKCNNVLGHGHNYQLQVTVRSDPEAAVSIPDLERLVEEAVVKPFDHKNLNLEVEDFKTVIPSVENIARAAFRRLKPRLGETLASVIVWETPKTWAEYAE